MKGKVAPFLSARCHPRFDPTRAGPAPSRANLDKSQGGCDGVGSAKLGGTRSPLAGWTLPRGTSTGIMPSTHRLPHTRRVRTLVNVVVETNEIKLINGDARDLSAVSDNEVDFVVTSPPYWDLKNYRNQKQVGLGQSYTEYLTELTVVFEEQRRVLAPGHFAAWVVGTRISDGDMKHIPADLIDIARHTGFTLKKEIIWVKPKGTQGLWQRGTTKFLKTQPHANCFNLNIVHEYILIFQLEGPQPEIDSSYVLPEDFIKAVSWSVWPLKVSRTKGHPAPFPLEIPRRLIRLYTTPGQTVLDPFVGTGTSMLAARELGRRAIGVEISPEYCSAAAEALGEGSQMALKM